MRIFENRRVFKKLIVVLLCILVISFCIPKTVNAGAEEIGGKLLNPILSFFVSLGDGAMALLQKVVLHADASLINVDSSASFWSKLIVVVAAIAIAAVAIAAVVITGGGAIAIAIGVAKVVMTVGAIATITFPISTSVVEGMLPDSFYLPLYTITPQEIFSNKIPLLDVDFFNPTESKELEDGTKMESTATQLRPIISNWYTILRDISLVALLSVLVYTGIRILISSTSNDKAKYKQMLVDWGVAICLLFVMQYIMAFSNLFVEKIIDLVDTTQVVEGQKTETTEPEAFILKEKSKVDKAYEVIVGDEGENSPFYSYFIDENGNPAGDSSTQMVWPAENFMQQARIKLQLLDDDKETYVAIGWKLIFVVLVVFTFIFIFTYLKRVVYMAFLTLIAPLVALTYPIDKMADGKAQAFNSWFKEYIFNLLIQPMHLILYTVLVGSAMDFASENILYVVVVLAFMVPAEKLLRKFFGFEKAHTPGLLGGPAGAAIMMNGMNKLFGKGPKGGKTSGVKENSKIENSEKQPRFSNNFDTKGNMIGEVEDNNETINIPRVENENAQGNDLSEVPDGKNKKLTDTLEDNKDSMNTYNNELLDNDNIADDLNIKMVDDNETLDEGKKKAKNNETKPSRFKSKNGRSIRRAAGAVGRYYGRKIKSPTTWINAAKFAGRGAVRLTGMAVGGTAGAIAGIASGDPTKFVQYTATGSMGGYAAAGKLRPIDVDKKLIEQATKSYYGSSKAYEERQKQDYIKNYKKNEDNIFKLEQRYDVKEAKEIMNNVVPDYLEAGVTDIDDIMAGYELQKNRIVKDRNMAISTAKYAKRIGSDTTKMKKKDRDDWRDTFSLEFKENEKVKKENIDAEKLSTTVLKRVDAFNKMKS